MAEGRRERTYDEDETKAGSRKSCRSGYYEAGWIRRKYRTHGWKATLMVINGVGHLAEAAWHHPDITASYAWLEVRSRITPPGASPTGFRAGAQDEDVVQWRAGRRQRARRNAE